MALPIFPLGDRAILVALGDRIDPEVNDQVVALYERLVADSRIDFLTPAFYSLGIGYDPAIISFDNLSKLVQQQFELIQTAGGREPRVVRIPVCYSVDFGVDLQEVAATKGLTCDQVIELHTSKTYRAYMLGFLPGFAYLGSVDHRLRVDRKPEPRMKVATGSVGLAGEQTGVYPFEAPGGWQIIGRTPVSLYDGNKDGQSRDWQGGESQLSISPGDDVQFYQIDRAEFDLLFEQSHVAGEPIQNEVAEQEAAGVSLHFKTAGLRTVLQDLGRSGNQHLGVPSGGAMDRFSATIANRLVGNADDAALIEITLMGPTIEIQGDCQVAITGGDFSPMLDGQAVAMWETIPVTGTQRLSFGSRRSGCRCYLAIAGEFQLPSWLGSVSISPPGANLGTEYRSLKSQTLVVTDLRKDNKRIFPAVRRPVGLAGTEGQTVEVEKTVQFLPGPEWDWFSAEQQEQFLNHRFDILPSSSSMGLRLPSFLDSPLERPAMISSAVVPGVIQVTPIGQPILLMRDAQTTGGYPRIGVVLYESLNEVAQLCPGDSIRFELG